MILFIFIILLIVISIYIIYFDSELEVSEYEIKDKNLPEKLNGLRISHISDYHDGLKLRDDKYIRDKLIKTNPDLIVISGDLIDSRRTNVKTSLDFIDEIKDIAPIFFAMGNHESRVEERYILVEELKKRDINVLINESSIFKFRDEEINIIGINDLDFTHLDSSKELRGEYALKVLSSLIDKDKYNILLFHRPEYLSYLSQTEVNIIFSGHAHGGQIRLFNKGIYAPGQGFLPSYTDGVYEKNDSFQVVSRGIGNSNFPFRFFNCPEIVSLKLKILK